MDYRCVQCRHHIKCLYVQYSPGNIRLMKCILLIDLMAKAYRHLFYNTFDQKAMNFELHANNEDSSLSPSLASLIWSCGKILLDAVVGNFLFISVLFLGTRSFLNMSSEVPRYKDIWLAILASSHLKLFLFAMMVWEFPSSVIFIIDIFVLSSNALALNVMCESAMGKCFGVCLCAHAVKFLLTLALNVNLANLIPL